MYHLHDSFVLTPFYSNYILAHFFFLAYPLKPKCHIWDKLECIAGPLEPLRTSLYCPAISLPPWRELWTPSSETTSFLPWRWGRRALRRLLGRRRHRQSCGYPGHCYAVVSGLNCRDHRGCLWATTSVLVYPCPHSAGAPKFWGYEGKKKQNSGI